MSPTAMSTALRPSLGTRPAQEGPVVLAAKPFDASEAPVAVARWLAEREDRELHIVGVLEQNDALAVAAGAPPMPQRYYDEERSAIAERMGSELAAMRGGMKCRVDVLDGPSARTIVDVAHDRGARVIVIGTGRHDSLGRFVYGERAMQIVRAADRPVLVVPRSATAGFVRHAVVAVDFSPSSLRAATAVLPMLSHGSRLTLLHVKPESKHGGAHTPGHTPHAEGRCKELFDRFIKMLPLSVGIGIETRVMWGEPVTVIDDFARTCGVSLIACGRRQNYTLAERLFVGSVSAGLLRRVNCPILIVPEQPDASAESVAIALTGVDAWPRDEWKEQIESFALRNLEHPARFSLETDAVHGGRCVAQDYRLKSISYDRGEERLNLMLIDASLANTVLALRFGELASVTLFTDITGNDTRLTFENATGRGTLTVATSDLP